MSRFATWKDVKEVLLRGLFATTLTALIGIPATGSAAAGASQSWSVVVHIEYDNGFVYEHAFATGVPTSTLPSILEDSWQRSPVEQVRRPVSLAEPVVGAQCAWHGWRSSLQQWRDVGRAVCKVPRSGRQRPPGLRDEELRRHQLCSSVLRERTTTASTST